MVSMTLFTVFGCYLPVGVISLLLLDSEFDILVAVEALLFVDPTSQIVAVDTFEDAIPRFMLFGQIAGRNKTSKPETDRLGVCGRDEKCGRKNPGNENHEQGFAQKTRRSVFQLCIDPSNFR